MLWNGDGKSATDGYRRLPENLRGNQVLLMDHSRLLLLHPGQPPELVDLKDESSARSLPELGSSTNILGWFGTNILCHWNGTNQILVSELRGAEFIPRGAVTVKSGTRPGGFANNPMRELTASDSLQQVRRATVGFAYNPTRQLMAWIEPSSSNSVYLASLGASGHRIELKSDVPGLVHFLFSDDGNYLAAWTEIADSPLRVWNVETGQIVASINERVYNASFAATGQVLVADIAQVAMNTNSEVKNTREQSQSEGAQRLRRFTARTVLGVRESQSWWTLKRPEGRAPFAPHDSALGFGMNTSGKELLFAPLALPTSRALESTNPNEIRRRRQKAKKR